MYQLSILKYVDISFFLIIIIIIHCREYVYVYGCLDLKPLPNNDGEARSMIAL